MSTPKTTGIAGVEPDPHEPGGGLARDEVEVRRVATDHRAERHDRVVVRGEPLRRERQLERARHPHDRRVGDPVLGEHPAGAVEQRPGDRAG